METKRFELIILDQLIISGERKLERKQEDKEHRYRRIERSYGNFQRTFTLPEVMKFSS